MAVNIDVFFFLPKTVYASGKSETPAATYPERDFFLSAVTGVAYLSSGRVRIGHVMTCYDMFTTLECTFLILSPFQFVSEL